MIYIDCMFLIILFDVSILWLQKVLTHLVMEDIKLIVENIPVIKTDKKNLFFDVILKSVNIYHYRFRTDRRKLKIKVTNNK